MSGTRGGCSASLRRPWRTVDLVRHRASSRVNGRLRHELGVVRGQGVVLETALRPFRPSSNSGRPHASRMSPKKKDGKTHKTSEILIPEKLYFRIGEVAGLCHLPAYVLRFWETEFPQLRPVKSSTGQRMYRRRDVESVVRIKQLLYDEGYTIAGARQHLRDEGKGEKKQVTLPFPGRSPADLENIRQGLEEILSILSPRR